MNWFSKTVTTTTTNTTNPPEPPKANVPQEDAQFSKWLGDFLSQDLGFNEFDTSEIRDKLMKQMKKQYLPVLQKAAAAHNVGDFTGGS